MSTPATPAVGDARDLPSLRPMLDEMRSAPEIVQPSAFWEHFVEQHVAQLEEDGFEHFKQTVNRQYFQWLSVDPRYDLLRGMARKWLEQPRPQVVTASLDRDLPGPDYGRAGNWAKRKVYATYVACLWEYVRRRDTLGLLDTLEEPALGDPVAIRYRGRSISEDLCNSVLEVSTMVDGLGRPPGPTGVIELGGGYGRIAWAFLRAFPGLRYVLVDIPPALAIAERYITTLIPDRPAFGFRHFDRYEDVADEWQAAQIAFLTPNQLELMPPQNADLFVNVSSLHEMRPDQIRHYIDVIGRHTAGGSFYTKQWKQSVNAYDDIVVRREDYPIPADWEVVLDRTHPVQRLFFEAMYRLPASS